MNRSAGFAVTPILKIQREIPMLSLNAETCRFACKRILPQVGVGPKERGKRLCIQQGFSCCQSGVTGSGLFFTMDANNWATFRVPSFWDVFQLIYIYISIELYIYRWLRYMHAHELICRSTCFRGFIMYMVRIPGKFAYIFKFYYNHEFTLTPPFWRKTSSTALQT